MSAEKSTAAGLSDPFIRDFLAEVQLRQPALWGILCHGRVGATLGQDQHAQWITVDVYLPTYVGDLDLEDWWARWQESATACLRSSMISLLPDYDGHNLNVDWLIPVPDELADFVARNSQRPLPSRFQSTTVELAERDGITWLTPPEMRVYDVLKASGWVFIPQPPFVLGEDELSIPDFLIYWGGKANQSVLIEVDSDTFHSKPSIRERDEVKERRFESLGFGYLRFSAKSCVAEPLDVVAQIKTFARNGLARRVPSHNPEFRRPADLHAHPGPSAAAHAPEARAPSISR